MENLILTAIPMFIFMGTMLEKSGVARDLLNCLQVLLRRVPGGLALSVTVMGTILAATTGIIGASVVMMSLLALPTMLQRRYSVPLATGTIAASGTLGILIPPSIMLVIMADLLGRSVGNLFVAAVFPGLLLAGLYMVYILVVGRLNPQSAPPLPDAVGPSSGEGIAVMVLRSFVPPVFLIVLVLGSILGGFATPTEAAGVGAMGRPGPGLREPGAAALGRSGADGVRGRGRDRRSGRSRCRRRIHGRASAFRRDPEGGRRAHGDDQRHDLRPVRRGDRVLLCVPLALAAITSSSTWWSPWGSAPGACC